jgi:Na+-transporting methylmalonyl-CoA/oxaloacetate decarboxylase gamma subunit
MNGKKTIGILGLSVVFIFICLLLLATWLYFFFRNENFYRPEVTRQDTVKKVSVPAPDPVAVQNIRDSLQQLYAITTKDLDSQIDSTRNNLDTLKSHLDTKLSESAGLRSEIMDILKNNNSGSEGMELARFKITMLQQKVNELRRINSDVEIENRRLRLLLNQAGNRGTQDRNPALSINNPTAENNNPEANINSQPSQPLSISDLRLTAMQLDEDREKETTQAQQADRFVGSFMVKNNPAKTGNAEIVVVVLQPDGQVLQNSTWESGTFETREGKRVYSLKVKCENAKDAASPYRFYLNSERFQKGIYTMQIYQNGNVIGRLVKTLS